MASSSDDDEDEPSFFDAEETSAKPHTAGDWEFASMEGASAIGRAPVAPALRTRSRSASRNGPATAPGQEQTNEERRKRSSSLNRSNRHSLPAASTEPAVPIIPARFLQVGGSSDGATRKGRPAPLQLGREEGATPVRSPRNIAAKHSTQGSNGVTAVQPSDAPRGRPLSALARRRRSLSVLPGHNRKGTLEEGEKGHSEGEMNRLGQRKNEDLFLELASDSNGEVRDRASSRFSQRSKRRSMPAEPVSPSAADRRPKSSGHAVGNKGMSRLEAMQADLQHRVERYRSTPNRVGPPADDATSVSGRSQSGHFQRYSGFADRSPISPSMRESVRSPEALKYGRRRPSFGAQPLHQQKMRQSRLPGSFDEYSETHGENLGQKESQESTSVDSEADDTVWDELDELKSRIKKLELTGKSPRTSGAAASSNETSERPRTATTAPTTIDSSPKRENQVTKPETISTPANRADEHAVGGPSAANIHPLLHSALAKAKPLLDAPLYRTLEATASDALQLAALTGGAGPQGTAFSAASIINGATVSDRHVRRKADTMCRNLTDLCLALCDGKQDASSVAASPIALDTSTKNSPSAFHSRSSLTANDYPVRTSSRPMSRLEARRTSILGSGGIGASQSPNREAAHGQNTSSQDHTPSHNSAEARRFSQTASRLQVRRQSHFDDMSGDEDPTIRPISRAMTDFSRSKPTGPREYNSPGSQRSPSLRDSLVARRANAGAHEENQRLSRVASLSSDAGRRRFRDHSTPPVLEEESGSSDAYPPTSGSQRRVTSLQNYGSSNRKATADLPSRTTSLNQRRHVVVE